MVWLGLKVTREKIVVREVPVEVPVPAQPFVLDQAKAEAAFAGAEIPADPDLGGVLVLLRRHAALLAADYGEDKGCRDIRKHMAWYLKGFSVRQQVRRAIRTASMWTVACCNTPASRWRSTRAPMRS